MQTETCPNSKNAILPSLPELSREISTNSGLNFIDEKALAIYLRLASMCLASLQLIATIPKVRRRRTAAHLAPFYRVAASSRLSLSGWGWLSPG
jgi:hypothetical protein